MRCIAELDYSSDKDCKPLTPVNERLPSKVETHAVVSRSCPIIGVFKCTCENQFSDPEGLKENQVLIPIDEGRVTPHGPAWHFEF